MRFVSNKLMILSPEWSFRFNCIFSECINLNIRGKFTLKFKRAYSVWPSVRLYYFVLHLVSFRLNIRFLYMQLLVLGNYYFWCLLPEPNAVESIISNPGLRVLPVVMLITDRDFPVESITSLKVIEVLLLMQRIIDKVSTHDSPENNWVYITTTKIRDLTVKKTAWWQKGKICSSTVKRNLY